MINLYLVTRTDGWGYDDYDSFVIAAASEKDAKSTTPRGKKLEDNDSWSGWPTSKLHVKAELIGAAADGVEAGTIVIASFNAG